MTNSTMARRLLRLEGNRPQGELEELTWDELRVLCLEVTREILASDESLDPEERERCERSIAEIESDIMGLARKQVSAEYCPDHYQENAEAAVRLASLTRPRQRSARWRRNMARLLSSNWRTSQPMPRVSKPALRPATRYWTALMVDHKLDSPSKLNCPIHQRLKESTERWQRLSPRLLRAGLAPPRHNPFAV
jgi:hypothetical protein